MATISMHTAHPHLERGPQSPEKPILSTKQQQEYEKHCFEINKHNTGIYNQMFDKMLEITKLNEPAKNYSQDRTDTLYWQIRKLSRDKMSIHMINRFLEVIFQFEEIQNAEETKKFDIIQDKLKFCEDLAKSAKLTIEELLTYSSKKICTQLVKIIIECKESICLFESFVGLQFMKDHVIPRAWFYLLKSDDDRYKPGSLMSIEWQNKNFISSSEVKRSLYVLIAQISCSKKLNAIEKKAMLQQIKNSFKFQNDQELVDLYKSYVDVANPEGISKKRTQYFFESKVLQLVMKKLGLNKKFHLEDLLLQRDSDRVLVMHSKKHYFNTEFFQQAKNDPQVQQKVVLDALEFLNKELKKNPSVQASDFPICFLEAFNLQFPLDQEQSKNTILKQCLLMQFIRIVELIFKHNLCENENFKISIIYQVIYVLKLGTEDEDIVDMSIYSLQILLNAIGIRHTIKYLERFFSIAVHAFLKYSTVRRIRNYTKRIFEFYIKDKFQHSQEQFKNLQFIHLNMIKNNSSMKEAVQLVHNELYKDPESIAKNLTILVQSLRTASEDIRILGTMYILELLESNQKDNEVRKVLVSAKVLKVVYLNIIDLKQDYQTQQNIQFSVICGKVIAAIGLQHQFVNDTVYLKATNQKTLVQHDQTDGDEKKDINVKSDYYNPMTNQQKVSKKRDETLEHLAIPLFNSIKIERQNDLSFAYAVHRKIIEISNLADDQPKNYFYSQFLLNKFIEDREMHLHAQTKGSEDDERIQQLKRNRVKNDLLAEAVVRHIRYDQAKFREIKYSPEKYLQSLQKFCFFLINKIEEKEWQKIFEACIPAIRQSIDIMNVLLPFLIYYAMRFNKTDPDIISHISSFINDILNSNIQEQIDQILKAIDFLNVCLEQDKLIFKDFIEEETKFRYVEKLFFLDIDASKNTDDNILNFIKTLNNFPHIKSSFLLVKKINKLKQEIDRDARFRGAQKIKNFKRCIFNFEENFRMEQNKPGNQGKGFLEVLPKDQTIEVVNLYKKINKQDFNSDLFNNIVKATDEKRLFNVAMSAFSNNQALADQFAKLNLKDPKTMATHKQNLFNRLMSQTQILEKMRNQDWKSMREWMGDFNLFDIDEKTIIINPENENPIMSFEMVLCLIFSEYHKGITELLRSEDTMDNPRYLESLRKINHFIRILYHNFMLGLTEKEDSYNLKLFLHVLYEIDSSVHYLKDILLSQKEQISEIINRDVNREKRRFEKVYYDFDMKLPFENLLTWFEERTQSNYPITSTSALMLIYQVRKMIFALYDRENEQAYYLMRIAKIQRKVSNDVLLVNSLFQECEKNRHRIIDFEYEYAKFTLKFKNAHDSYQYIISQIEEIKEKCDKMYKDTKVIWLPPKIYEKAVLLSIELQIKIDARNPQILPQFSKFVKDLGKNKWEKPFFKFGQYLDLLDVPACGIQQPVQALTEEEKKKRLIQKIFYYIKSLEDGHKYIWQSLPKALQLWFDYKDDSSDDSKIQIFMRQELGKLDNFKLATALQILLSRQGHPNPKVRETIQIVLSKLACAYPGQSAWWIFHFLYFDEKTNAKEKKKEDGKITRGDFAKDLINKITAMNKQVALKILESEKIFFELKKLSEKQPAKNTDSSMDMPQFLQKIARSNLVMPIEENLSVQLPPKNYNKNYQLNCLVNTMTDILEFNKSNADIEDFIAKSAGGFNNLEEEKDKDVAPGAETCQFHAYKEDPIMVQSFMPKVTIMHSKEKPKKIEILGSDGAHYNFLLKCDKYGDLRKEQRFIDFAVLCNKMLENDAESRKRNLRLRTYAIVPLSRNTGLIEWIQNTNTLKNIVGDYWKKNNIKGEMQDIKKKATELKMGETHTQIWSNLRADIKPVLGSWIGDHFPSPEIWYEAKMNFIKSTAIWSMIGYIIGLGDRHGDNILIHAHTGEVTHVDFDCIFEKGAKLRVPEIVPFRLTQNIIDAFGIFQEKGVFKKSCEIVLRVLRKNAPNIKSFLYSFIHDPLIEANNNVKVEIKDGLNTVSKKLTGQISATSGASATVEEQVEQVILNAINDESLKQMYIGWMPWL